MNKILLNIVGVFVLVAIVMASYIAYSFLMLNEKRVANEARYQCAISSKYEVSNEDTGITVSYPVTDIYEKCLDEKGL